MSLATTGSEGLWAAPVFYVNEGFELFFMSRDGTRHVRNLASHPRVAVTISDDAANWLDVRGVQLEGVTAAVAESRRREVLASFSRRYAFVDSMWWTDDAEQAARAQRLYGIRPDRVFFLDHKFQNARMEIAEAYLPARLDH